LYVLARRVSGIDPGCYHYAPAVHGLERLQEELPSAAFIGDLFLGQPYVGSAALVVVLAARVARTMTKYRDRGYRYILFEAGHAAQNLNLAGVALGLGSVNLGGFFDAVLASLLGLDADVEVPLYGIAVGVPEAALSRTARRQPGT
jgi:SagB-type dehydrogenase family enzyme